jgi:hypothetical protein
MGTQDVSCIKHRIVQPELANTGCRTRKREKTICHNELNVSVQRELALTDYEIASGGQSESDTEKLEFVQPDLALTTRCGKNCDKYQVRDEDTSFVQGELAHLHIPVVKK